MDVNCRIEIETLHPDAEDLAACLRPDNTEEMDTFVDDGRVVTVIERPSPGSLRSTADDYVRNLSIALDVLDN